jgi:transcriptional regulator
VFVPRPDAALSDAECWDFVRAQGFGHLIAPGEGRDLPVVVPTQFVVPSDDEVVLHLAAPNPVWDALTERPRALLSVAGDWAYIPTAWKAIGDEDPRLGIPTTYYAAVQLECDAEIVDDDAGKLAILRTQLRTLQPDIDSADPQAHAARLSGIHGLRLTVTGRRAKFKFGGNVDTEHRLAVAALLDRRGRAGDAAARTHLLRRLDA